MKPPLMIAASQPDAQSMASATRQPKAPGAQKQLVKWPKALSRERSSAVLEDIEDCSEHSTSCHEITLTRPVVVCNEKSGPNRLYIDRNKDDF